MNKFKSILVFTIALLAFANIQAQDSLSQDSLTGIETTVTEVTQIVENEFNPFAAGGIGAILAAIILWLTGVFKGKTEGVSQAIHDAVVEQVAALKATIVELRETITNLTSTNDALTQKDTELRNELERKYDEITALKDKHEEELQVCGNTVANREDTIERLLSANVLLQEDIKNDLANDKRDLAELQSDLAEEVKQLGFIEGRIKALVGNELTQFAFDKYFANADEEGKKLLRNELTGWGQRMGRIKAYTDAIQKIG